MHDPRRKVPIEDVLVGVTAGPLKPPDLQGIEVLGASVSNEMVRSWRNSLAHGGAQVLEQISGSMAETIAAGTAVRLPNYVLSDVDPTLRRIGEQITSYTTRVTRELTTELYRLVEPAARAAATDFAVRTRDLAAEWRGYQEALWDLHWWVPGSVPMSFYRKTGLMAQRGERVALRRELVSAGRRMAGRLLADWMDIDAFRDRARFLRDGVEDLRRGRYRVSIPMLLPQLEGIAFDVFAPGSSVTSPVPLLKSPALAIAAGDAMVETVTVLWARQDFSATPAGSRRLSRHLVLHGRSTGYGTGENAVKVVFALDQLASMVRRSSAKP